MIGWIERDQTVQEAFVRAFEAACAQSTTRNLNDAAFHDAKYNKIGNAAVNVHDWVLLLALDFLGWHKLATR